MSIQSKFPNLKPTLLLDFTNNKGLDPRITFTRGSTATYYDGRTTVKAEENLLLYSEQLDNAAWLKASASVTATNVNSPNGTPTADQVTITGFGFFLQRVAVVPGATYTVSFYALAGTATTVNYFIYNETAASTLVDSTNYIPQLNSSTWTKVSFSFTTPANCTSIFVDLARNCSNGTVNLWGAQLEQRASATAYTPTTTAPVINYIPAMQTAAAGVPRFDHNPITGEALGLLIEEQRTNELTQTANDATGALLYANAGIGSVVTVTRYGGTTEITKTGSGGYAEAIQVQSVGGTVGDSFTYSVSAWVKVVSGNPSNITYGIAQNGPPFHVGMVSLASLGVSQLGVWYKISTTQTITTTDTATLRLGFFAFAAATQSTIQVREMQAERAPFATSFIPTYASQITRAADNASMTSTNFSSWYRTDEGSIYQDFTSLGTSATDRYSLYISENGSPYTNGHTIRNYNGANVIQSIVNSVVESQVGIFPIVTVGVPNKVAYAYKINDFAGVKNGGSIAVDTSGILPTNLVRLDLPGNGCNHIKKIAYYPRRLGNSELQALTT